MAQHDTQEHDTQEMAQGLLSQLPAVRGKLRVNAGLAKVNWFRAGGPAQVLFKPEDMDDLGYFIAHKPAHIPLCVLGVGSNLLVRDGGIDGVVLRLGKHFARCDVAGDRITVGAGCLNATLTALAQEAGIGGLEFLSGIPGSLGGALFMNAGAYGKETCEVLVEAEAVDTRGQAHMLTPQKLCYGYRHCGLPEGWIFTRATLQGAREAPDVIAGRMAAIARARESTQPVRSRTGGSTFGNPLGHKAWQLIDAAGCRGMRVGDAQVSPMHCNFLINTGNATAFELETLGENVRGKVLAHSGIALEWEIRRIGKPLAQEPRKAVA